MHAICLTRLGAVEDARRAVVADLEAGGAEAARIPSRIALSNLPWASWAAISLIAPAERCKRS